tara:strand:- start:1232 stop:1939 length:708 start_codon:yes stop_codon:yes gene_type:complete
MPDTLDLTTLSDEPVESNVQVEITDAPEETVVDEGPVEEPVVDEEPVETAGPEETVEEVPEETPEAPVEEEAPEESVAPEEPEEASAAPVEQVAADIRNILTEVPATVETSEPVVSEQLCSLKTLTNVLGKWSGGEIKKINIEKLLKEGTEVDENLDDIEKFVEVLKLWIGEGGSTFREHNHFKKLDEYTLSGESKNLSEEKKVEVLKTLTELVVNVSQKKVSDSERDNIFNNLY